MSAPTSQPSRAWVLVAACGGLLAGGVAVFYLINSHGVTLSAPEPPPGARTNVGGGAGKGHVLFHVLLALAAVLALGRVLGKVVGYLGQPPVIGELLAGIVLGPSLLGRVSPDALAFLLPADAAPHLGIIAQLGAVLYMFLVGLGLDAGHVRERARSVLAVAAAGLTVPFVAGAGVALALYPVVSHRGVPFTSFGLFVGVAMAVTAFPILARILTDRKLERTAVGVTALGAAAAADVAAWCLLALVVGVAKSQLADALWVVVGAVAFVAVMLLVVRPLVGRFVRRHGDEPPTAGTIGAVFVGVLVAALATEAIGIHAVFGAFLFGALIPHDSRLARDVGRRLTDVVTALLLPAFFAFTGLRTQIGLVSSGTDWAMCGLIVVVAFASKFGAAAVAARLTGQRWRESAAIGALMTTHGLMELIVLNIGLDLGVISPTLFAMMVVMTLVTTTAAGPIVHFLMPAPKPEPADEAAPSEKGQPAAV
jgi:Kef-type K+ transport system membrane component KefB